MDIQSSASQRADGSLIAVHKSLIQRVTEYAKALISLMKMGIVIGNVVAATGGFFLASAGQINFIYYLITMLGISLVIASGCVFNNIIDTDIDCLMQRTQDRVLVTGQVSKSVALAWSMLLLFAGFNILAWFTNTITLLLGAFGWLMYVVMYTLLSKRQSVHSTLVGSFSGSTPPVMGYTAVTGQFDLTALLIFLAFCAWQIPHTYAIAVFRSDDYRQSNIPLLPLVKGYRIAKNQMLFYTALYILAIFGLFVIDSIHAVTFFCLTAMGIYWLVRIHNAYDADETSKQARAWGRELFFISIMAVSLMSLLFSINFVWSWLFEFNWLS